MKEEQLDAALQNIHQSIHTVLQITHVAPFVPKNSKELYNLHQTMKLADTKPWHVELPLQQVVGVSHSENKICKLMPSAVAREHSFRVNLYPKSIADCLKPENFLIWLKEFLLTVNKFFSLLCNCSMVFVSLQAAFCTERKADDLYSQKHVDSPIPTPFKIKHTSRQTREEI